jgi:hypothetical protein
MGAADRWHVFPRLPGRGSITFRHAHATHRSASGVHPKVAGERLGIPLDLYSHVLLGMQVDAALRAAQKPA